MDIKDLAGLSKPLTRLIEVISSGVGKVFSSHFIRKEADSRAYAIKTIAEALNSVSSDYQLPVVYNDGQIEIWQKPDDSTLLIKSPQIEDRIDSRIDYQERKRQNNIESITSKAASNLINVKTISDNKPDEDWITRFFNYAQDISSIEMQELWGRILSGEIKNPGSYSLRTLDSVRNMTKNDAMIFEHLAKFALKSVSSQVWIIPTFDKSFLKTKFNIFPAHQFILSELNLMYPTELSLTSCSNNEEETIFLTENDILLIKKGNIQSEIKMPIWKFTQIGSEIISLVEKNYNDEYIMNIANYFKSQQGVAIIGKIKSFLPDGRIEYDIVKELKND